MPGLPTVSVGSEAQRGAMHACERCHADRPGHTGHLPKSTRAAYVQRTLAVRNARPLPGRATGRAACGAANFSCNTNLCFARAFACAQMWQKLLSFAHARAVQIRCVRRLPGPGACFLRGLHARAAGQRGMCLLSRLPLRIRLFGARGAGTHCHAPRCAFLMATHDSNSYRY